MFEQFVTTIVTLTQSVVGIMILYALYKVDTIFKTIVKLDVAVFQKGGILDRLDSLEKQRRRASDEV